MKNEVLESLREMLSLVDTGLGNIDLNEDERQIVERAESAIAKAEGRA